MNKDILKKGTVLTAVNKCIMYVSKRETLTIGKDYYIIEQRGGSFDVINDLKEEHTFYNHNYKKYFKIK